MGGGVVKNFIYVCMKLEFSSYGTLTSRKLDIAFIHCAIGCRFNPSWSTHISFQAVLQKGVTKAVVCAILCGMVLIKDPLQLIGVTHEGQQVSSHNLNGPFPLVQCQIIVNKMCLVP